MYFTRYAVVLVSAPVFVGTLACAGRRPTATETPPASAQARATGTSKVLSIDELSRAPGRNALELLQELRPQYLRNRGPLHAPTVFVDYLRRGGTDALREIPASSIAEIRYLDSRDATQLFGSGYTGGIIHVLTARMR